jgi:hypothetical protein
MELNYSTSAAGFVYVDALDPGGAVLAESAEIIGDHVARTIRWKTPGAIAKLAGRPVRLRFRLKDADVYSFRFLP